MTSQTRPGHTAEEDFRAAYEEALKRAQAHCPHKRHGQRICMGCASLAVVRERERDSELVRLRAENERLRKALEKHRAFVEFAKAKGHADDLGNYAVLSEFLWRVVMPWVHEQSPQKFREFSARLDRMNTAKPKPTKQRRRR